MEPRANDLVEAECKDSEMADDRDDELTALWDAEAETFDEAADHGLRDPVARQAWQDLLLPLIGRPSQLVADLGCGTGTLSVLLAEAGHAVHGVDFSAEMLRRAREKAVTTTSPPRFTHGDAAAPPLASHTFDAVLSRHVLWAMPDPGSALRNWIRLLKPDGQLVLIEGRWSTGAGLTASECRGLVSRYRAEVEVRMLTDAALWGRSVADERYLLVSAR